MFGRVFIGIFLFVFWQPSVKLFLLSVCGSFVLTKNNIEIEKSARMQYLAAQDGN